jgi:peptide/nickel transport system permease protein
MGYLRKRILQAIITLYAIVTLGFVFIRMMPGGPTDYLIGEILANPGQYGLPPDPELSEVQEVLDNRLNYTPGVPIHEQYLNYMTGLITEGSLGQSVIIQPGVSNVEIILRRAPWTIFLSSVGLVYGLVASIMFGSTMAYYEGSKYDIGTTTAIIFMGAIPYYVFAILLVTYFSWDLGWFPRGGRVNPDSTPGFNYKFIAGVFEHAALPMISITLLGFAGNALGLRANSIRVLGEPFIRNARLRGLSAYTIATRYMARNAILPMYTGIVIGIAGLLGGAVIIEQIFTYSGMGLLMYDAAIQRDFPLLTANLIIITTLYVVGTLLADFTYALVDPRAEQSSMG